MPKKIQVSEDVLLEIARRRRTGETDDTVLKRAFGTLRKLEGSVLLRRVLKDSEGSVIKRGRRRAKKRQTAKVENACLRVSFEGGPAKSWQLPTGRKNEQALGKIREQAIYFARRNGATEGQVSAVKKALTDAGYRVPRKKRKKGTVWLTQGGLPSLGKRR